MSDRGSRTSQSRLRLLWDELLSPRVPRALNVLGYRTSYVGDTNNGQPPKGSTDEEILQHALTTRQVIVTSNHDMMLVCAEAGQQFVWIDPRGKQLTRAQQVLLVLHQIDEWQVLLESNPGLCIRARRGKPTLIDPSEAARLVEQRMKALERRQRLRSAHALPTGTLFDAT